MKNNVNQSYSFHRNTRLDLWPLIIAQILKCYFRCWQPNSKDSTNWRSDLINYPWKIWLYSEASHKWTPLRCCIPVKLILTIIPWPIKFKSQWASPAWWTAFCHRQLTLLTTESETTKTISNLKSTGKCRKVRFLKLRDRLKIAHFAIILLHERAYVCLSLCNICPQASGFSPILLCRSVSIIQAYGHRLFTCLLRNLFLCVLNLFEFVFQFQNGFFEGGEEREMRKSTLNWDIRWMYTCAYILFCWETGDDLELAAMRWIGWRDRQTDRQTETFHISRWNERRPDRSSKALLPAESVRTLHVPGTVAHIPSILIT